MDKVAAKARREKQVASQAAAVHRKRRKEAANTNYMKAKAKKTKLNSKRAHRKGRLKSHGLTPGQYGVMVLLQKGRCAICNTKIRGKKLAVDHDHETGRIRGLLCNLCNSLLGFANEDIDILKTAISYLKTKGSLEALGVSHEALTG